MNERLRELARRALEKQKDRPSGPRLVTTPRERPREFEDETPVKSQDAMDHRAFKRGGFSKAEKQAYAKEKFMEELVQPPKNPPPAWLSNPDLLPKKPPKRQETE